MSGHPLLLCANTKMPSQRAQALQVAQAAAAFAKEGTQTTILFARRKGSTAMEDPGAFWDYYSVPRGRRPSVWAIPCTDFIDSVPRFLQYVPARIQELTFAKNASHCIQREFQKMMVLSRELETALHLVRAGRFGVYMEIHRVPGSATRKKWLIEAAKGCTGIVAISGGVKEDLMALGISDERMTVAHDGYQPERFENLPSRADARAELGLDAERPLVIYTGGLLEWKGVDLLVDAARELEGTQFVIAGGMDRDVEALRKHADGVANVRIDGFQPPGKIATYLAAADLGVVPNRSKPAISARYTSPLKIFEAMAVGLPLVVSDLFSMRDVLSEDQALFVAPDDAGALARGIAELLGDEARRESMSKALSAEAEQHTWSARARRILDWIDEIG